MSQSSHPIRLVAGIEIRPPAPGTNVLLDRDCAAVIGQALADDLARCVPDVTRARLVTGPALLEPGQVLSPDHAPWAAMQTVAESGAAAKQEAASGLITLGASGGRLSHDALGPYRDPPDGLFLCLPMLVIPAGVDAAADERETLETALERELFDTGGVHPPALAELSSATGLEPVHGQLMTLTDLAALVKMQLAGAGLDPFWPPIEHALLATDEPTLLDLPAGLRARWNPGARGWELVLRTPSDPPDDDDALWLRSFRQSTALLETHLIPWRAVVDPDQNTTGLELDEENRWVVVDRGPDTGPDRFEPLEHPDLGLIGFDSVADGQRRLFLPLVPEAVELLRRKFDADGPARA